MHHIPLGSTKRLVEAFKFFGELPFPIFAATWQPDGSPGWRNVEALVAQVEAIATANAAYAIVLSKDMTELTRAWNVSIPKVDAVRDWFAILELN